MRANEELIGGINENKTINLENGDIYEGQVGNDGMPHGKGILKNSVGIYEGEFKNGEKEGKGVFQ